MVSYNLSKVPKTSSTNDTSIAPNGSPCVVKW